MLRAVALCVRAYVKFKYIYIYIYIYILAKVPALSCRLGHVPYNHGFGILTGGCAPYNRAFSALMVRSLSITKKLN